MGDIPTVTIKHPTDVYAIINQSDFDPAIHQIYDPEAKAKPVEEMSKDEVREELQSRGVDFDGRASLIRLRDLLAEHMGQ